LIAAAAPRDEHPDAGRDKRGREVHLLVSHSRRNPDPRSAR
jgi:hypothetical protein